MKEPSLLSLPIYKISTWFIVFYYIYFSISLKYSLHLYFSIFCLRDFLHKSPSVFLCWQNRVSTYLAKTHLPLPQSHKRQAVQCKVDKRLILDSGRLSRFYLCQQLCNCECVTQFLRQLSHGGIKVIYILWDII